MMKAHLMYRDHDFNVDVATSPWRDTLVEDLNLSRILDAMAYENKAIHKACYAAMFTPLQSIDEIKYRHAVLDDARQNPETVLRMYEIVDEAAANFINDFRSIPSAHIDVIYHRTIGYLRSSVESLGILRRAAIKGKHGFKTDAFRNLCDMLQRELGDGYLKTLEKLLNDLTTGEDAIISASLGDVFQGTNYKTRKPKFTGIARNWLTAPSYSVPDGSVTSNVEKAELLLRTDLATDDLNVALRQSAEYIGNFFTMLRNELAFYLGCLNLEEAVSEANMPLCEPGFFPADTSKRSWRGLYDVALALVRKAPISGNDIDVDGTRLFVITGANQGGKSTYMRAIGQAILMSQCGMAVGADSYDASLRLHLFTHFKREEDAKMKSGKLDEELVRMGELAKLVVRGSVVMMNESFASTNEREGSEICRQVTEAFIENGVEVFSVSHMYEYTTSFKERDNVLYLRAQRLEDGGRSFRIEPGEPLVTAFGDDIFKEIFGKPLPRK